MGDATEENYLPGPLLDTKQVKNNLCSGCMAEFSSWETQQRRTTCLGLSSTPSRSKKQSLFWLYGGGFVMGDATEENYLPGPLLDTKQVKNNCFGCMAVVSSWETHQRRTTCLGLSSTPSR
jgi:hypothetical protein